MSVVPVDVADLVAIAETVKADIEDVKWQTQRKVVLLASSPPHSAAVLAGVVVLLPLEGSLILRTPPRGCIARAAEQWRVW